MLGLGSFSIFLIFVLTILSSVVCIIYGIINWNKGLETENFEQKEEKGWLKEEAKIEKTL